MSDAVELRILCSGGNWMRIGALLALGMTGYYSKLPKGSTVAAVGGDPGVTCHDAPLLVAHGDYDMAITTPIFYGQMAYEGRGLFDDPLPLRALAAFPHDDRLVMAVREETGITSLRDLVSQKPALRISTPPLESLHPACVVADEVLKAYGSSFERLQSQGAVILKDRPRNLAEAPIPVDPSFEAIFDEAIMTKRWTRIFDSYSMRVLPLDEDVLSGMSAQGYPRGTISPGRLPGLKDEIPTLDFSGWLLFCRANLPDEIAALAVESLEEQAKAMEGLFAPGSGLTGAIDLHKLWQNTGMPLHPGAECFYREHGYMSQEPLGA